MGKRKEQIHKFDKEKEYSSKELHDIIMECNEILRYELLKEQLKFGIKSGDIKNINDAYKIVQKYIIELSNKGE